MRQTEILVRLKLLELRQIENHPATVPAIPVGPADWSKIAPGRADHDLFSRLVKAKLNMRRVS